VGITCQNPSQRWNNGGGYKSSPHFYSSINKYGWDNFEHEIIAGGLMEKEAKNFEKILIEKLNTRNKEFGYNITRGGDGSIGLKHSNESRIKMSEHAKNRIVSSETREKMRNIMLGREFTDEWKSKISESLKGDKNSFAKPVVQLNGNYELIKEFTCERYAEQELGINVTNISQVCLGKAKSAGGYIFMFKPDYEAKKDELNGKSIEIKPYRRKVIQLTLNNELIACYESIKSASEKLNIDESSISNVCKGRRQKTAGGFKWEYAIQI